MNFDFNMNVSLQECPKETKINPSDTSAGRNPLLLLRGGVGGLVQRLRPQVKIRNSRNKPTKLPTSSFKDRNFGGRKCKGFLRYVFEYSFWFVPLCIHTIYSKGRS